ncbi:MAG: glycosyltransferase [Gammaproteobacteria bacterium]|nr:glycosyltransferase [Gammaproteobacteria bacterium]
MDDLGDRQRHLKRALEARWHEVEPAVESRTDAAAAPPGKPRLAYVSPMTSSRIGLTDQCSSLLLALAEHYRLTLVVDPVSQTTELPGQPPVAAVISAQEFAARAHEFDRVLYRVGNARTHAWQLPLIQRHPGTVVLDDVFLFDAVSGMQDKGLEPGALRRQLYDDHGYAALLRLEAAEADQGRQRLTDFPVNGAVIREAAGILVNSNQTRSLLKHWWGDALLSEVRVVPRPRVGPEAKPREEARQALAVGDETLVIVSVGAIAPARYPLELVQAFLNSSLGHHADNLLVLIGEPVPDDYASRLMEPLSDQPQGDRVRIVGDAKCETYRNWLGAADIAVQIGPSHADKWAAVIDAMAHGLAVVVDALGEDAELPQQAVELLAAGEVADSLGPAMQRLADDAVRRRQLGENAREWVARNLAPSAIADRYHDAIEDANEQSRRHRQARWHDQLAALPELRNAPVEDLPRLLARFAAEDPCAFAERPRILIDVSTIAWHDFHTGIQRVTRELAAYYLRNPPAGFRVELVRWVGDTLYLAQGFATQLLGLEAAPKNDAPAEPVAGDAYLTFEWAPPLVKQVDDVLRQMRQSGVRLYFTVHDLLPLDLPHCFPDGYQRDMREWFERISRLAHGITCVSRVVADDVRARLPSDAEPWVEHFHLGADFSTTQSQLRWSERARLSRLRSVAGPVWLMVGTLEPRKGHEQVLDAMQLLWDAGTDAHLVIVGKHGWNVDELASRLRRHPESGRRLHWFNKAGDAMLGWLYARCDAVVAASLAEGFGLPLVEAALHKKPVIARDIPVFREVAGSHARYFRAQKPEQLADFLSGWITDWRQGTVGTAAGLPILGWSQSAVWHQRLLLRDLDSSRAG